jgi:lysophospholipid acyltransferase (LPLAT)-like uncharacterized protein
MMRAMRRSFEQADWPRQAGGWLMAQWVRFCHATTRWDRQGDAEVAAALYGGPVQVVLWHEHLMMAAIHWPQAWGQVVVLTDVSPAARLGGEMQTHFGMRYLPMSSRLSNLAAAREVMRLVQSGLTLGVLADGPRGPAREMKDAPIDWARVAGRPIVLYAYAQRRQVRLNSWDRMIVPLPFSRGICLYRRFDAEVPRRAGPEEMAQIKARLTAALDSIQAEAEAAVGR